MENKVDFLHYIIIGDCGDQERIWGGGASCHVPPFWLCLFSKKEQKLMWPSNCNMPDSFGGFCPLMAMGESRGVG